MFYYTSPNNFHTYPCFVSFEEKEGFELILEDLDIDLLALPSPFQYEDQDEADATKYACLLRLSLLVGEKASVVIGLMVLKELLRSVEDGVSVTLKGEDPYAGSYVYKQVLFDYYLTHLSDMQVIDDNEQSDEEFIRNKQRVLVLGLLAQSRVIDVI